MFTCSKMLAAQRTYIVVIAIFVVIVTFSSYEFKKRGATAIDRIVEPSHRYTI